MSKVKLETEKLIIAALKYLSAEKPITNTLVRKIFQSNVVEDSHTERS